MSGARVEKIVGKNKDADRQIILWIIYKVYKVIYNNVLKKITKDSKVGQIKARPFFIRERLLVWL